MNDFYFAWRLWGTLPPAAACAVWASVADNMQGTGCLLSVVK